MSTTLHTNHQPVHYTIEDEFYRDKLYQGTSCGLEGSKRSGTLGGLVVVEKCGERIQLGLTNCHVLLHGTELNLENTIGPCSALEKLQVVSPSDKDHEVFTSEIQNRVAIESRKLNALEQAYGEELLSDSVMKRMEEHRTLISGLQSKLTRATSHNRLFGTIFATSGFTTRSSISHSGVSRNFHQLLSWALDWCLIRLGSKVKLSSEPPEFPANKDIEVSSPLRIWKRVDPLANPHVKKRGRSTGWTRGRITAIDSSINPGNGLPQLQLGKPTVIEEKIYNLFGNKIVAAHSVVSQEIGNLCFVQNGDSGSIVLFNENTEKPEEIPPGTILGMIYASNDLVSYMMPMEIVVDSIEAVTGGKVVEPQEWTVQTTRTR